MSIHEDILSKGFPREDSHHSIAMPVYNNAAFEFATAEDMAAAFRGDLNAHTYSRISNPTVEFFEQRVKALSGACYVTALASGMAAITNTFFCIAGQGMNIVSSPRLFGNTYGFFMHAMREFGVDIRFCEMSDFGAVERNIDENTCALFTELISNPSLEVVDLKALSAIARAKKVPFIVDTTLIPWTVCKTREWGVDIEVVSSTKYISGGGTSIGGLIVDHATYDWNYSPKLRALAHESGTSAFNTKLRKDVFRNLGACMAPQTAFMQNVGLETLDIRYRRMSSACMELARFLEARPEVEEVLYPGLESSEYHVVSLRQFGECPGALLSFSMRDKEACFSFIDKLRIIRRSTNLFDHRSLIIHPSSTIYHSFSEKEKASVGVTDKLIRLSVGLEDVDLLKKDMEEAFRS